MNEFIQLKEDNILRVGIKDVNGNLTDCTLEFDLEDIELPLNASKMEYEHKVLIFSFPYISYFLSSSASS